MISKVVAVIDKRTNVRRSFETSIAAARRSIGSEELRHYEFKRVWRNVVFLVFQQDDDPYTSRNDFISAHNTARGARRAERERPDRFIDIQELRV